MFSDQFLRDADPQNLLNVVLEQGREIAELKQAVLSLQRLSSVAEEGGELGGMKIGSVRLDEQGLLATADIHKINWWLPINLANDSITTISGLVYDGTEFVYVAGRMSIIGGQVGNTGYGVARYSLITRNWEFIGRADNPVLSITYYSGTVYAGGSFTDINGVSLAGIGKWNGTTWSAMGSGASGGAVAALLSDGTGNIYATGAFTSMGGVANTARIAKWNGTTWSALGTGLASGQGTALILDGAGNLWTGGTFSGAGGVANTAFIAKWNGSTWSSVGVFNNSVLSFAYNINTDVLYVGGDFSTIDSVSFVRVAMYVSATWQTMADGLNGAVNALAIDLDSNVVAGGAFTDAGGYSSGDRVAVFVDGEWQPLSNGGGVDNTVNTLLVLATGSIIAGGSFNNAGAINCQSIAIFCKPLSEAIDIIASLFELYAPPYGTYTPTITNSTNVAASTPRLTSYFRVGNMVTVFGQVDADPTAGSANTSIGVSLPIASVFSNSWELAGNGTVGDASQDRAGVSIVGDTTNNRATFAWFAPDGTNRTITFMFSYRILP